MNEIVRETGNSVTEGRLFRVVLALAGPMFASAVLQNIQSLIDLFWVGRLGAQAVAAIALSFTILMMMFPLVMGMATGAVAVVARRIGEGREQEAAVATAQALMMAVILGVAAGLLGLSVADRLGGLLGADPRVAQLTGGYLRITFMGSFTVFLLFTGSYVLRAAGDAVTPMFIMGLANVLNLVLDPILIFGLLGLPAMGVRGAAIATVLSQAVAAVVTLVLLLRGSLKIHLRRSSWRPCPAVAASILRIGMPGSGQMLARGLMSLVLMRIVAGCGTAAVAAYGIGLRFHMIVLMPAFALGTASATLVGQSLGAGRPERARAGAWMAAGMDLVIMALSGAGLIVFARPLMRVFAADPEVVSIGVSFLRTVPWFYVFTGLAIVLGRSLQGAGDTIAPMVVTVVSLWGVQVPLAVWLSARTEPAVQGIWWAIAVAGTLHGILVTAWFQLGRWQKRAV